MNCPKCGFSQVDQNSECIRCGIIFEKYRMAEKSIASAESLSMPAAAETTGRSVWLRELLFFIKDEINPFVFAGRVIFFLVLFIWGLKFIFTPMASNYAGESFWHLVNLPFHEAGHVLLRPFGRFITSLGGTLGQLAMPLICITVFVVKTRDTFAAAFALWWLGENFMDIAPYIDDARSLTMPLLGGNTGRTSPYGFHDWEFILKESGLIRYEHVLAIASHNIGIILMILSFAWGGYILMKQYKNLNLRPC
jgi:hypothetical protein